jgi:hypothetical protein
VAQLVRFLRSGWSHPTNDPLLGRPNWCSARLQLSPRDMPGLTPCHLSAPFHNLTNWYLFYIALTELHRHCCTHTEFYCTRSSMRSTKRWAISFLICLAILWLTTWIKEVPYHPSLYKSLQNSECLLNKGNGFAIYRPVCTNAV